MLIKIAKAPYSLTGNNSYIIFDNVISVDNCSAQPMEYTSNEELLQFVDSIEKAQGIDAEFDHDRITYFRDSYGNGKSGGVMPIREILSPTCVYRINRIDFSTKNGQQSFAFDTICYICNDEGKTIEKCFAGGVLNKEFLTL